MKILTFEFLEIKPLLISVYVWYSGYRNEVQMTVFYSMIISIATAHHIPPSILMSICFQETKCKNVDTMVDHGSPSYGPMQIKLGTARMFNVNVTPEQLRDPRTNITYAAKYLSYQYDRYQDWSKAVSAYNSGSYSESKKIADCPRNLKYLKEVRDRLDEEYKHHLLCGKEKIKEPKINVFDNVNYFEKFNQQKDILK